MDGGFAGKGKRSVDGCSIVCLFFKKGTPTIYGLPLKGDSSGMSNPTIRVAQAYPRFTKSPVARITLVKTLESESLLP